MVKTYAEMDPEQRFVYRMGEQWLRPIVENAYNELQELNAEWFSLDDNTRRVWMQNALGLLAGAMLAIEERESVR